MLLAFYSEQLIIENMLKIVKWIPAYLEHFAALFLKLHLTASKLERKLDFVSLHKQKTLSRNKGLKGEALCKFLGIRKMLS